MRATRVNLVRRTRSTSDSGFFAARSGSEQARLLILDALGPLQPQQAVSNHEEIRQRTRYEQAMSVLRDAAVAHLGEVEDAFEDSDRVFGFGAHARASPVDDALPRREVLVAAASLLREVFGSRSDGLDQLGLTGVSAIAPDVGLFAMKQLRQHVTVAHVRSRGRHRVDELGLLVDTHVRLHAEEPLIALLRLMHLGVALSGGV